MSIDQFLNRRYDRLNYNCVHFVCDVWEAEVGEPIRAALEGFLAPPGERRLDRPALARFERLARPLEPSLVLMRRPRQPAHVGIYIRGRVAHIRPSGAVFQPLNVATYGYKLVGFYGYANCHNRP